MYSRAKIYTAALAFAFLSPTNVLAMVGEGTPPSLTAPSTPHIEKIGCYRLGLSGYHWYHFCAGPGFLYPHHRVCRHGACWYR